MNEVDYKVINLAVFKSSYLFAYFFRIAVFFFKLEP